MKLARLVIVLAALAGVLGLFAWREWGEMPRTQAIGPDVSASSVPAPPAPAAVDPTPTGSARETAEAEAQQGLAQAAAPAAAAAALRGRVVVVEPDGSERLDAAGKFQLILWEGERGRLESIPFEGGEWSKPLAELGAFEELSVDAAYLDGRAVPVEQPAGRFGLPADRELLLRLRRPSRSILRVVDADTGVDLAGISLVKSESFPREDEVHPGPEYEGRQVVQAALSPLDLDAHIASLEQYGKLRFLVGAPGYAWQLVDMDRFSGGERLVALARGADLSISVRGVDPAARALLRLRAEGVFSPVVELALERDSAFELRGLPPGEYRAVAEIGEHFRSPLALGEVRAALTAGALTRVDLVLEAAPALATARGGGLVLIAEAWRVSSANISLNLLDTPLGGGEDTLFFRADAAPSPRDGFEAFRWSREGLQVGRYELALHEPPYSVVVELPLGGSDQLDLEVPPPAELSVHVVDDLTGQPVETEELHWNPRRPEGVTGGGLETARRHPRGPGYLIRAPAAEIELMLWAMEYQPYSATIDLSSGLREHTIRLQRGCGLVLRLADGETPVAFPEGWDGQPKALGGAGHTTLISFGDFERKFTLSEPGTYAIELPAIPGYLQPPVQQLEIVAGQFLQHAVALERKQ